MELVIAQSVNDFSSLEKLLSASTDILVLDAKRVRHEVVEDFTLQTSRIRTLYLPLKWSADFIDKYIYPVDNGAPGENTAKYI